MATGFCYSKTGIYVLSACVVRGLYLHGLPTGYASWAEAGLYDSGIPYGHPSPIDSSISACYDLRQLLAFDVFHPDNGLLK